MQKLVLISILALASFLRLINLSTTPPSLYWDEVSLGNNAYSVLKTGLDEYGNKMQLTNFPAFGDYKPPLYIYAVVPVIAVFGLNEFSVRFPSAFFGILTVFITYFLVKKIFDNKKIALVSIFFLAISPWHLQFSRGAFEANLGLFFSTLGIYLFINFPKNPKLLVMSAISFVAAMYTFTGQRLFVPFIVLFLGIFFKKDLLKNKKYVVSALILGLLLISPLLLFMQTKEGKLRFKEVTIFNNLEPILTANKYKAADNETFISNVIHNRRIYFVNEYLIHYFDAFNPAFLFTRGDINPRLSIQDVGELYYADVILILAGIYFLFSHNHKYKFLIIGWLLISPLGPATARETPHALRMIHILPTFQILSAYGLFSLYEKVKYKKVLLSSLSILLVTQFLFYIHTYYSHWPKTYSGEWQFGYKRAVEVSRKYYDEVDKVIVTKELGRPYAYFLFYGGHEPKYFHETKSVTKDEYGFLEVNSFGKYIFSSDTNQENVRGKLLIITQGNNLPLGASKIETVYNLAGKPVFDIGIVQK